MSVKMVIGALSKQTVDTKPADSATLRQASALPTQSVNPQSVSQQVARLSQNTEAVVTTLRSFRTTTAGEPIKDPEKAAKLANKISDDIRKSKSDGLAAHDGVSSEKSSTVLVN